MTEFPDETDHSKYAGVLNDMFFTVYNEMFSDNLAQKLADEVLESIELDEGEGSIGE